MEETKISQIKTAGPDDIDKILEEVRLKVLNAMRGTDEYELGRLEERSWTYKQELLDSKRKMLEPAEMFYNMLSELISKDNILQFRIGIDHTTGVPAVLSVISKDAKDKLDEIRDIAAILELYISKELDCDGNIWTMVDHELEQSLVEQDFPYCRMSV